MQKKINLFFIIIFFIFLLSSCNTILGTKYVTNPKKYGKWETYLDVPTYLPSDIDDYHVNSYSYTLYAYMDICYEIFLDITVSEEQFNEILSDARNYSEYQYEQNAYYDDRYIEIVYKDYYSIYPYPDEGERGVGSAYIKKIIYNKETLNVIYVCFHAIDTNVYDLADVAYFRRFLISEEEYVENINKENKTEIL
ncbi:MAG: hypothetical protein E7183_03015 [Erysipelotrichaceae bacterium]|nr:hypothetical protein [Erysipelotrichaceae bacterium]